MMEDNMDVDLSASWMEQQSRESGKMLLEEIGQVCNGKMTKAEAYGFSDIAGSCVPFCIKERIVGGKVMNPIKMWNKLGLFTKIMIGFALGIGAGLVLGRISNEACVPWNYFDQTFNHGSSTTGAWASDLCGSRC